MRILIVLRGAPGAGKSTFIKKWDLDAYTLCGDAVRWLYESPIMDDMRGKPALSMWHDKEVWKFVMERLEEKMERGEFVVIDATHTNSKDFNKYKLLCEKYRYKAYCVTFEDIPIETCKERNLLRPEYKHVPDEAIDKLYMRLKTSNVPNFFTCIRHDDDEKIRSIIGNTEPVDANKYEKVVVFGDIHGCFDPLKEYFDKNPYNENTLYVFTGDYTDRGLQNKEVLEFLISLCVRPNVVMLEGNHEHWVLSYLRGDYNDDITKGCPTEKSGNRAEFYKVVSSTFFYKTIPQIADIDKKGLFRMYNRLGAYYYFTFGEKRYFVNHAGVGFMNPQLVKVKATTFTTTRSDGRSYSDPVDKLFEKHELERNPDLFQIHAHRNTEMLPIRASKNSFNLCDSIERGGNLRILEITKD